MQTTFNELIRARTSDEQYCSCHIRSKAEHRPPRNLRRSGQLPRPALSPRVAPEVPSRTDESGVSNPHGSAHGPHRPITRPARNVPICAGPSADAEHPSARDFLAETDMEAGCDNLPTTVEALRESDPRITTRLVIARALSREEGGFNRSRGENDNVIIAAADRDAPEPSHLRLHLSWSRNRNPGRRQQRSRRPTPWRSIDHQTSTAYLGEISGLIVLPENLRPGRCANRSGTGVQWSPEHSDGDRQSEKLVAVSSNR